MDFITGLYNFCVTNWAVIAPFILVIISELMSLNSKWQSNGILQFIANLLKKKQAQ